MSQPDGPPRPLTAIALTFLLDTIKEGDLELNAEKTE
jgi:hypothetical protein